MAGVVTRRRADIGLYGNPPKPIKIPRLQMSSSCEEFRINRLQPSLITFEFGPSELNLYKYVAEESSFLWRKTKETYALRNDSEPLDGLIFIHGGSDNIQDICLKLFEFAPETTKSDETGTRLLKEKDYIVVCYLGVSFWNENKVTLQEVGDAVKDVEDSRLFIVIESQDGIEKKMKLVKGRSLCPASHIIRANGDKGVIYDGLYAILESNLSRFLSDLETKTITRHLSWYKSQLEILIGKLHSRKSITVSKLREACIGKIKAGIRFGVIGYRLCGDTLYILENENLVVKNEKFMLPIRKSIQENFQGKVIFHALANTSFKPHCTVKCGEFLENADRDRKGTIGIFGELKDPTRGNSLESSEVVILSSGHLFHEGEIAKYSFSESLKRIGHCIWPTGNENPILNLHDISIIQLDFCMLGRLQKSILKEKVIVDELSKASLNYKKVFKFGAETKETFGFIEKIDDFEMFGGDVMIIVPKSTDASNAHGKFSDRGDSGAIVLTREKDKLYAIGMVYGDQIDFLQAECASNSNESIAIGLRKAVDRFTKSTNKAIVFDKI
ncbi:uncharacterized protein LOC125660908 isoform X3 [Ostrea edulis]|uniref:uncharacterized protein LOC125660908 isoform X3 n=1 Tax=Ostrea edulis TaxID=37623 RepID=UPI0024AFA030|nr:uncharacterized protein LOC125660908 isoform X3 [Ostrea edulis]